MLMAETEKNGNIRHYSDVGYDIKQNETGSIYQEAIDPPNSNFTYSEIVEDKEITIEEALAIIIGMGGRIDEIQ